MYTILNVPHLGDYPVPENWCWFSKLALEFGGYDVIRPYLPIASHPTVENWPNYQGGEADMDLILNTPDMSLLRSVGNLMYVRPGYYRSSLIRWKI
jgi:hypothetical protein